MNDLMTTNEVAAMLKRPPETLRYWRWRGEGPASFKVGRTVRYERRDVEAWLRARKAATISGGEAA